MNKERLLMVAEAIKGEPDMYNQCDWGAPWCGTPGCIAGWAFKLFGDTDEYSRAAAKYFDEDATGHSLGLKRIQYDKLFDAAWPITWLINHEGEIDAPIPSDYDTYTNFFFRGDDPLPRFIPTANDAVKVLLKIIKGDVRL